MKETPELDEEMADFVIEHMEKTQHSDAAYFETAEYYSAQGYTYTISSFSRNQHHNEINRSRSISDIIDDLKKHVTTNTYEIENVHEVNTRKFIFRIN